MFERDSVLSVRPVPTHGLGAFASVGACGRVYGLATRSFRLLQEPVRE